MKVELHLKSIEEIKTEALLMPVDGNTCSLGSGALTGLKNSLKKHYDCGPYEWMEMQEYLEDHAKKLAPIPHGKSKIIEGDGDYKWLVIAACQPHNVNGEIISKSKICNMITSSLIDGIRKCVQHGIKSVALTLINTKDRIGVEQSMRSIVDGFVASQKQPITVRMAFSGSKNKSEQKEIIEKGASLLFVRGVDCQVFL